MFLCVCVCVFTCRRPSLAARTAPSSQLPARPFPDLKPRPLTLLPPPPPSVPKLLHRTSTWTSLRSISSSETRPCASSAVRLVASS